MKNYKDSDYALNKYSEGIVYKFADRTVEITLEDYLNENPGKTEQDFREIKALSDEIDNAVFIPQLVYFRQKKYNKSIGGALRGLYNDKRSSEKIGESQTEWLCTIALPDGFREQKNGKYMACSRRR